MNSMKTTSAPSSSSLFCEAALLEAGWAKNVRLVMRDGQIVSIEQQASPRDREERVGCMLPGIGNVHSHAFQRGMAGMAERRGPADDSFWTWREVMYRFLDRLLPEDVRAIAGLAYMEMLESGFTRVGEFHYLHHDHDGRPYGDPAAMCEAIVQAADDTSLGLTLLPVFYAYSGFGGLPPRPEQRRFVNDVDGFVRLFEHARQSAALLPDAVVGVAPHSLRAVSPEQLRVLSSLAPGKPMHIHIAEQTGEVDDCVAWSGRRPIEWLYDQAVVDARWCLVHATHMSSTEAQLLARSGAVAGLCPITEANLGDGIFPLRGHVEAGGAYAVGSDSNVLVDCMEELRLLEYGQRLKHRERNILARGAGRSTGADLHAAVIAGGAAALGVKGGLATGHPADMFSLDLDHPTLAGRRDEALLDALIFAAGRAAISSVWRRGVPVVRDGRHRDRASIVARYKAVVARLAA
jgi:formimidoylglutamate deiminase